MRAITDPPGGDPRRKAEQLAFAQLLADYNAEQQLQKDLANPGFRLGPANALSTDMYPSQGTIAKDPALREEQGRANPAFTALEQLTPVGDVMTGLEGLGAMLMGEPGVGGAMMAASLLGAATPGKAPKPNAAKLMKRQVDPTASRVALPTPGNPIIETNSTVGSGYTITRRHPDDRGALALAETPNGTLIGSIDKAPTGTRADGDEVYDVLLGGGAASRARQGNSDELIAAQRAAISMLESVPVGARVQSSSYSTNSLPMLLTYWRQGKLSAGDSAVSFGDITGPINSMGRRYQKSTPVTDWHYQRGDFAMEETMSKEEFFDLDPDTKALVDAGKMRQAGQRYEYYVLGSENKWGVTNRRFKDREEAERVAATFAQRVNDGSLTRQRAIDTYSQRGVQFAPDETPLEAEVVENFNGTFSVHYPLINFKRNFEDGGKYRVIKQ